MIPVASRAAPRTGFLLALLIGSCLFPYAPEAQPGGKDSVWIDSIPPGREAEVVARDFSLCLEIFAAMDTEINLFTFDRMHPHLEALYRTFAEMKGLLGRLDPDRRADFPALVRKVKERTEDIHVRYDSGDLEMSQVRLRELIRHVRILRERFADGTGSQISKTRVAP